MYLGYSPITGDIQMTTKSITVGKNKINVDDVFYSVWGYEQTNVNYYQVTEVKGKSTVVLCEIRSEIISHGSNFSGEKQFILNDFKGDKFTRRVKDNGDGVLVRICDSENAHLKYDNKPVSYSSYG